MQRNKLTGIWDAAWRVKTHIGSSKRPKPINGNATDLRRRFRLSKSYAQKSCIVFMSLRAQKHENVKD